MPRVRWILKRPVSRPCSCWCVAITLCCSLFWILDFARADCWYEEERHEEGVEVATVEPCLNCTCSKGVLLCYLRVCPKLPNPPPSGCILLHRYRTCCPELICPDIPNGGNALEARSDPEDNSIDFQFDRRVLGNACLANGSIYGPGSAMDSSSLCEYCYCLRGRQTCVKPKCLLPIEGCTPTYEPSNCCPVHYNCTRIQEITTSTTTTVRPRETGGCLVDGTHYPEGGKVLGVGHSICDNCYCLRGLLRCEPLSCAPPLLGCTPVIRTGECCAASYNCSGTIEIQPEPNYGQFPTVSKEYAKLRKEVQQHKPSTVTKKYAATENSNIPYYVIAESSATTKVQQRNPGFFGTTRHFSGVSFNPSTVKPFYYKAMPKDSLVTTENKHSTRSYNESKHNGGYFATTNYEFQNNKRPYSTTSTPSSATTMSYNEEKLRSSDYLGLSDESLLSIVDSLLDTRLNRRVENETTTENIITTSEAISENTEGTTFLDLSTITDNSTEEENSTTENLTTETNSDPVTVKTVTNTTDCIDNNDTLVHHSSNFIEVTTILPVDANEINKLAELKTFNDYTTTDAVFSSEITTYEDVTEVDLESRVKVSSVTMKSIPPDIEAILNITKNKDPDYDYDYNEPSLPPSLPNLRIIPFVAADALDSKKQTLKENNIYPQERISDTSFGYASLFSPPVETEGGFVPKEPPILENFYENAVTVPSITNPPNSNELDCLSDGRKIAHEQSVPSDSPCVICTCFYGNIVCQKPECPMPRPACRKSTVQDLNLCCPQYVCDDEEAPTVVLDRQEGISSAQEVVTVAEGVVTPDPFRDVIRTEAAPDLQSLIVDMMPFLARKTTPMPPTTSEKPIPITTTAETSNNTESTTLQDDFSLDKVLQLLFSEEKDTTTAKQIQTTSTERTTTLAPSTAETLQQSEGTTENLQREIFKSKNKPSNLNSVESGPAGVGLLKLAGCNIYGRMYRVGRIISELSGPCLECKCTEIGVQCRALKC